ncbi:hypothetical protein ANCCAN_03228 [Ancylostoma caninum]|uniref:Uncharacterized protein n=1 Tax=Ancylostoma caninum TaxID=29170 RepID=A0A368H5R3_ANCCA|nr:hypothetical protein ANCCAN_03228 [Ancylostoma caninum]
MKFVVVLAVAVLAVALSKPHPKRSSESSSEENPKHKPHHKHHGHHHGHHHRSSTPPAPTTEETVTTAGESDESTQFGDITTEPVEIVTSDAGTDAVTAEDMTVVPTDSGATVESAATTA